jgi:glyoxylase I family protein
MHQGVNGIHHLAVSVPSLKAAEEFYVDKLGMEKSTRWDFEASEEGDKISGLKNAAAKTLMVKAGNLYLELFEFSSPIPKTQGDERPVCDHGYTHLAFDVDNENIEKVYKDWEAAGVRWHHPLKNDEEEGVKNAYGRDPFGNVIEIQALRPDVEFHMKFLR